MNSPPAPVLVLAALALLALGCGGGRAEPEEDPGPALQTEPREQAFGSITASGLLPRGWGTDIQGRLTAVKRVADLDAVVMSIDVEPFGVADSTKLKLEMRRRKALEMRAVGGEKPELLADLEERAPGIWSLVTRVREAVHPDEWTYRAVVFHLPEQGSAACVCTGEARLAWVLYWKALRDICAGLECTR